MAGKGLLKKKTLNANLKCCALRSLEVTRRGQKMAEKLLGSFLKSMYWLLMKEAWYLYHSLVHFYTVCSTILNLQSSLFLVSIAFHIVQYVTVHLSFMLLLLKLMERDLVIKMDAFRRYIVIYLKISKHKLHDMHYFKEMLCILNMVPCWESELCGLADSHLCSGSVTVLVCPVLIHCGSVSNASVSFLKTRNLVCTSLSESIF